MRILIPSVVAATILVATSVGLEGRGGDDAWCRNSATSNGKLYAR